MIVDNYTLQTRKDNKAGAMSEDGRENNKIKILR
jgi:hypothetical protein